MAPTSAETLVRPGPRPEASCDAEVLVVDEGLRAKLDGIIQAANSQAKPVRFPLLAPGYAAHTFDYTQRDGVVTTREWIQVFRKSLPAYTAAAAADPTIPEAARPAAVQAFASAFGGVLDTLDANPHLEQVDGFITAPLNCSTLCRVRDEALQRAGFVDIFKPLKDKENAAALELLPGVLRELDSHTEDGKRLEMALRGVFAGNVFDMGCAETAQRATSASGAGGAAGAFAATRDTLLARPWAVDDLDALLARFAPGAPPHRKAILFVDNAGPDVVLGMIPLARELLKRGTEVVLAANAQPSINDITAPELTPLLAAAAAGDATLLRALTERALRVVSSGNDLGVIDLARVSPEIAAEAEDGCDLVVMEGMGRGIETNLWAQFSCDSAKLAMIKHPEVARLLGGRMYEPLCKFDRAAAV